MAAAQFPAPDVPEVAFLGRSNVGKSSLLNALVGEKAAKVSSTPGRTRAINFFALLDASQRPRLVFADLPGYGYAKISKSISAGWPALSSLTWRCVPRSGSASAWWTRMCRRKRAIVQLIDWLRAAGRDLRLSPPKSTGSAATCAHATWRL